MSAPQTPEQTSIEEPVAKRLPPAGRKFPCAKCGARLDFDPSIRELKCPYCGHREVIEPSGKHVEERDWDDYWQNHSKDQVTLPGRSSQVTCTGCGAVVLLQDNVATDQCPYCATHLENQPESAKDMIAPGALLPFVVSHRQAIDAFSDWIARRWFAPSSLQQFANLGKLTGVYVPFWTYDSMTYTHYTGERGDDYTETESYTDTEMYTETDADGNSVTRSRPVTRTRQVTKTRWSSVSGEVDHFFDDILIYASQSLPEELVGKLEPWQLEELDDFKAEYLSGFQTERYTIGLRDGFGKAREIMDAEIRGLCRQDIGGDHQRLETVRTQHVGITFKHILLPVWLAAYRYYDQPYQILINGRSGRVAGTRPYSWVKILLLVLFIIAMILALFAVIAGLAAAAGHGQRPVGREAAAVVGCVMRTRADALEAPGVCGRHRCVCASTLDTPYVSTPSRLSIKPQIEASPTSTFSLPWIGVSA
jgi:DNA-directed RNA polymerase subunit RPC12/RpoP